MSDFSADLLTASGARSLDRRDPLRSYRGQFHFPRSESGAPLIYLAGNSLGLQPRSAALMVRRRLEEWASDAVESWHRSDWMEIDGRLASSMARIVGAFPDEVSVAGTLTANLHFLMASFYRPRGARTRILMETHAFPSDQYAAAGQAAWHGLEMDDVVIRAQGSELLETLQTQGDTIALVLLSGINYLSGEVFDMEQVTAEAHAAGCVVGLDLAHAAGNIPLSLNAWTVDFAAWCSYKYLNGGPGAPAAFFVHRRHHGTPGPRLAGWWGHEPETRFLMRDHFTPATGAAGWKVSTPPVLALGAMEASMELFDRVGMDALFAKSQELTGYLHALLMQRLGGVVRIATPHHRGAQLSLQVPGGRAVFDQLRASDVVCDWREPDVIRAAPVPLYNSFQDVWHLVDRLAGILSP